MASLYLNSNLFNNSRLSLLVPISGTAVIDDRGIGHPETRTLHILCQLDGKSSGHTNDQPLSGNQETESIYEGHIIRYWYGLNEADAVALLTPPEIIEGASFAGVIGDLPGIVHIMASEQTSFLIARAAGFGDRLRVKLIRRIDQRKT